MGLDDVLAENECILGCTSDEQRFKALHAELGRLEISSPPTSPEEIFRYDVHVQYAARCIASYNEGEIHLPAADVKIGHLKERIAAYRAKLSCVLQESYRGFRSSSDESAKNHFAQLFEAYAAAGARYGISLWFHDAKLEEVRKYQMWYDLVH